MTPAPLAWLGAPSSGGLALPNALPTATQLYAPRGVWLDDAQLVATDSGNHRVLIWFGTPARDHRPADVVLGQRTFFEEGPRAAGRGPENGLHLPTGVAVIEGRLFVADAWHHRILVWNRVPQTCDARPDEVLGQEDFSSVEPNRGGAVSATGFYWPYGLGWVNGCFVVADTGNRRVLVWRGVPRPGQPADCVIGQDDATQALENRGDSPSARSFRWPHAVAGDADALFVADAGNHRVLGWAPVPIVDEPARLVVGQKDFGTVQESPYAPQNARTLRFPYAVACDERWLAVADTANNRVVLYPRERDTGSATAEVAIGQVDLGANGENRWTAVSHDTLCWPYGICLHQNRLAVADSGNNRVMVWQLTDQAGCAPRERSVSSCV